MGDDVFQANNLPSTRTPRGHQGPAGFLMLVSGLDKVTVTYFFEMKTGVINKIILLLLSTFLLPQPLTLWCFT
jgi:hypothetical protein